jgi:Transposase, Mutator family
LTSVVATCYLLGVSTRRMDKLVESLGITRVSKSQVSVMARDRDAHVASFRTRPLDAGPQTAKHHSPGLDLPNPQRDRNATCMEHRRRLLAFRPKCTCGCPCRAPRGPRVTRSPTPPRRTVWPNEQTVAMPRVIRLRRKGPLGQLIHTRSVSAATERLMSCTHVRRDIWDYGRLRSAAILFSGGVRG